MSIEMRKRRAALVYLRGLVRRHLFEERTWILDHSKRYEILTRLADMNLIVGSERNYQTTALGVELEVDVWLAFAGFHGLYAADREIREFLFDLELESLTSAQSEDGYKLIRSLGRIAFPRLIAQFEV